MEFQYMYSPYSFPQEDASILQVPVFQDDSLSDSNNNMHIDPILQLPSHWDTPQQVQRYLKETQKTAFFNPGPPTTAQSFQSPTLIAPLPPPSQRHGSPLSSHEPSSICSSGESDFYHDNMPATPSEVSQWSPQTHFHPLMGLATPIPPSSDTCVNLVQVNPLQEIPHFAESDEFDGVLDYNTGSTLQRGYSLQSQSTHYDTDIQGSTAPLEQQLPRMTTPDDVQQHEIKAEIHISTTVLFDEPDADGSSSSSSSSSMSDVEPLQLATKKKEDDSDYKPLPQRKAAATAAAHHKRPTSAPKGRNNKRSMTRSSEDRSSPAKRARMTGSGGAPSAGGQRPPRQMISANLPTGGLRCPECPQVSFNDQTGLNNHVKKQHTRPFMCVFNFAGCASTFASKNEWKRHVMSQHLLLHFWLCTLDACAKHENGSSSAAPRGRGRPSSSSTSSGGASSSNAATKGATATATATATAAPALPSGAIFNRKDLFTQHIRRMHMPPAVKKASKQQQKKNSNPRAGGVTIAAAAAAGGSAENSTMAEWEDRLRAMQKTAEKQRCALPEYMTCPAKDCSSEFRGADAWDLRMEHVARHLERAANQKESAVVFGGEGDPSLMAWAASPAVAVVVKKTGAGDAWVLNNPLKAPAAGAATTAAATTTSANAIPAAPKGKVIVAAVVKEEEEDDDDDEDDDEDEDEDEDEEEQEGDVIVVEEEQDDIDAECEDDDE